MLDVILKEELNGFGGKPFSISFFHEKNGGISKSHKRVRKEGPTKEKEPATRKGKKGAKLERKAL